MGKKPSSYLTGSMIVGTAIGALVGLLMAPKSGRDTREVIKTRAGEAPKYLQSQLKELPQRGRAAMKELPSKLASRMRAARSTGGGERENAPLGAEDDGSTREP